MRKRKENSRKRLHFGQKYGIIIYGEVLINKNSSFRKEKSILPILPEHKNKKEVINNKKMDNQYLINVVDAANYLIQFYYRTREQYHCTKKKVEKMLTIAAMVYMKHNLNFFGAKIYLNHCGTYIPLLSRFIHGDIVDGTVVENNAVIDRNVDMTGPVPKLYVTEVDIEPREKDILLDIFINFGNYEPSALGKLLDEFKNEVALQDTDNPSEKIIDPKKVFDFFKSAQNNTNNNEIINYIANYCLQGNVAN